MMPIWEKVESCQQSTQFYGFGFQICLLAVMFND